RYAGSLDRRVLEGGSCLTGRSSYFVLLLFLAHPSPRAGRDNRLKDYATRRPREMVRMSSVRRRSYLSLLVRVFKLLCCKQRHDAGSLGHSRPTKKRVPSCLLAWSETRFKCNTSLCRAFSMASWIGDARCRSTASAPKSRICCCLDDQPCHLPVVGQ